MATRLIFEGGWTEKRHILRLCECVLESTLKQLHVKMLYYVDVLANVSSAILFIRRCSLLKSSIMHR